MTCNRQSTIRNLQSAIKSGSGSKQQQMAAAGGNSFSNNGDQQSVCKETSNLKQTATKTCQRIKPKFIIVLFLVIGLFSGCKINYTFTGASVSPAVKTFSVDFFTNNAPLFQPTLSQTFTEGLKDKLSSQTRLNLVSGGGDLQFEGEITNYSSGPISVQSAEMASVNRLTISVKVKFTNSNDPKQSYDRVFTQYEDYPATSSLSAVEGELIDKIVAKLTEDIFNKSLANW